MPPKSLDKTKSLAAPRTQAMDLGKQPMATWAIGEAK